MVVNITKVQIKERTMFEPGRVNTQTAKGCWNFLEILAWGLNECNIIPTDKLLFHTLKLPAHHLQGGDTTLFDQEGWRISIGRIPIPGYSTAAGHIGHYLEVSKLQEGTEEYIRDERKTNRLVEFMNERFHDIGLELKIEARPLYQM